MWLSKKSTPSLVEHLNRVKINLKKSVSPHLFNSACSNREDKRKGYNTDRALIPTVSSFPPLDSCPPSAMHYKRLIMTVTAPQVCRMLDLLFSSQAFLSLPLTTCTGTQSRRQWHTHTQMHTRRQRCTHPHSPSHSHTDPTPTYTHTQAQRISHSCCVSGILEPERGGVLHESASHNCCIRSPMIWTHKWN